MVQMAVDENSMNGRSFNEEGSEPLSGQRRVATPSDASRGAATSSADNAAHRSLPFGSRARVTNTETGQSVVVEVNDRGPFAKGRILDVSAQAAERLVPGGTLLLYTGAAYAGGHSPLIAALEDIARDADATLMIEELDPDVFGEELDQPGYEDVERIAAIGVILRVPG